MERSHSVGAESVANAVVGNVLEITCAMLSGKVKGVAKETNYALYSV